MSDEDIKVHLERIRQLIRVEDVFPTLPIKPPIEPPTDERENPDRIPTKDEKGVS